MQRKKFSINSTIDQITDYAPAVLFTMMCIMFGLTGWMQYQFYGGILPAFEQGYLVFFFPIVMQVLRFVTGFLSGAFFKKRRWFMGLIVLMFSIWLSVYEYNEAKEMAIFWTDLDISARPITHSAEILTITKDTIQGIMTVLIWGALVLEFFLAAWLGGTEKVEVVNYEEEYQQQKNYPSTPQDYLAIQNAERMDKYLKKLVREKNGEVPIEQNEVEQSEKDDQIAKEILEKQIREVVKNLNLDSLESESLDLPDVDDDSFSSNGQAGKGSTNLS